MLLISKTYWLGMPFQYKGPLPEDVQVEPVQLKALDYRDLSGLFYRPPENRTRTAVLVMHPRADFQRHYCIPRFAEAGYHCLGLATRCLNNDTTAVHEDLILDVAAGVRFLKEQEGIDHVILFGNSGGGSLFAFYQAQAVLPPEQRLERAPSGKPTWLAKAEMPPADAFICCSAHKGEGRILMDCIDPAVTDENDPGVSDPALDLYDPANGFAEPPNPSRYSDDFLRRFRAGQRARVQRLDARAHALIREARRNEELYKDTKETLPFEQRQHIGRRAAREHVMVVYRTMANPLYVAPELDPSKRSYGSLFSERPDLMNHQYLGFARVVTPEAWLSTWSALSSNADLERNIAAFEGPVLCAFAERDREIHPKADAEPIWNAVTSTDRTFEWFDAEHYFEPEYGAETAPDVEKLMDYVIPWADERFAR
jgi:hypothetical protein